MGLYAFNYTFPVLFLIEEGNFAHVFLMKRSSFSAPLFLKPLYLRNKHIDLLIFVHISKLVYVKLIKILFSRKVN